MLRRLLLFCSILAPAHALPVLIYDGSLGTSPTAQNWALGTLSLTGGANESVSSNGVTLTTTGTTRSGYSPLFPLLLDRNVSYNLTFDLQLNSESHSSNDRAGLSIVVVGNDLMGIEIGFWTGEVWAQNVGFTHGTGSDDKAYDTTQRTLYTLGIGGNSYQLSVGGTVLLSGSLRDYSASGAPYNIPNFLFVGDDTFSANASSSFFSASLSAPEPTTWLLGLCGIVTLAFSRRFATR